MKPPAAKEKNRQLTRSRLAHRASGPTTSYPKTRVRGSRLLEAAFILAFIELTHRLHQAYHLAYDETMVGSVLPQKPEPTPQRNCTFPGFDQLSAAQQGLLNAGAYGGLSDAQRANFLNQTGALARAGINLGNATLQTNGTLTDRLLFNPGESLSTFRGSIVAAIASGGFIKDTPFASEHPGMSEFGARQAVTTNALQAGFGRTGAFVDIDRGGARTDVAGFLIHMGELITPGGTDPFAVGKALGSKVTGYTCR
jgi:hypothetical protein